MVNCGRLARSGISGRGGTSAVPTGAPGAALLTAVVWRTAAGGGLLPPSPPTAGAAAQLSAGSGPSSPCNTRKLATTHRRPCDRSIVPTPHRSGSVRFDENLGGSASSTGRRLDRV